MRYRYEDLSFESSTTAGSRAFSSKQLPGEEDKRDEEYAKQGGEGEEEEHEGVFVMPRLWNISMNTWLIPLSIVLGVIVGAIVPGDSELSSGYRPLSSIIGWVYFFSWTLSFYPQIFLNFIRKNTVGFNTDKLVYDFIGFGCLSVYTYAFRYVSSVRESYKDEHNGNSPTVQVNDVAFALHAFAMTFVQIFQVVRYNGLQQVPSRACLIGSAVTIVAIMLYFAVCITVDSSVFIMLNWLYFISFVKIGVTLIKYAPQVLLNHRRRSTKGWSITACILDFTGSSLSIMQLVLDCYDTNHMDGIWGNIVKLALGAISLVFDGIFFCQHFILYPREGDGYSPLLPQFEEPCDDKDDKAPPQDALLVNQSGQLVIVDRSKGVVVANDSLLSKTKEEKNEIDNDEDDNATETPYIGPSKPSQTSLWNQEVQSACFGVGFLWEAEAFVTQEFGQVMFPDSFIESFKLGYLRQQVSEDSTSQSCNIKAFECTFAGGADMYLEMVKFFFQIHDPTLECNVSTPQASTICCYNEEQMRVALNVKAHLQLLIDNGVITCFKGKKVLTQIVPRKDYHLTLVALHDKPSSKVSDKQNIYFRRWP